jgi:hypothetical protein
MRFGNCYASGAVIRPAQAASASLFIWLFCVPASLHANEVSAPCMMVAHPFKESSLKDTEIPGDFTKNDASITIHWEGSKEGVALQKFDPPPTTFKLGDGGVGNPDGRLAGQGQSSTWNIKGVFNFGRTLFTNSSGGVGFFRADACLTDKPAFSLASTAFKVTGGFDGGTVKLTGNNVKDDALADSDAGEMSKASGDSLFTFNGTTILDVTTVLQAQFGATGSIVDDGPNAGLTLLASLGQFVSFSAVGTDSADPSESFSWLVTFTGTGRPVVTADGIGDPSSFFLPVAGGWFLPFDAMPSPDLSADLGSGQLGFVGVDTAQVIAVPEPSSLISLVAGFIGVLSLRRLVAKQGLNLRAAVASNHG